MKVKKAGLVNCEADFKRFHPDLAEIMTYKQFMGEEPVGTTDLLDTQEVFTKFGKLSVDRRVSGDLGYFTEWNYKGSRILFDKYGALISCTAVPISKSWYVTSSCGMLQLNYIPSKHRDGDPSFVTFPDTLHKIGYAEEVAGLCRNRVGDTRVINDIKNVIMEEFNL